MVQLSFGLRHISCRTAGAASAAHHGDTLTGARARDGSRGTPSAHAPGVTSLADKHRKLPLCTTMYRRFLSGQSSRATVPSEQSNTGTELSRSCSNQRCDVAARGLWRTVTMLFPCGRFCSGLNCASAPVLIYGYEPLSILWTLFAIEPCFNWLLWLTIIYLLMTAICIDIWYLHIHSLMCTFVVWWFWRTLFITCLLGCFYVFSLRCRLREL